MNVTDSRHHPRLIVFGITCKKCECAPLSVNARNYGNICQNNNKFYIEIFVNLQRKKEILCLPERPSELLRPTNK